MKPWDELRREVSGAWRSVRYDLDHRSKSGAESKSRLWPVFGLRGQAGQTGQADQARPADPDITAVLGQVPPEGESIWAPLRSPRRLMTTMAVASGIAASATGTFFAVSGGLGILLVDSHSSPTAPQTAPASAPQVVASTTPAHRPVPASRRPSPSASATASARVSPTPTRSAEPANPSPSGTVTKTKPSASATPVGTPSATVSHISSPSATPTASPTP